MDDKSLLVQAKTSSLGPGYHAHLVDALEAVAEELGFDWYETDEEHDETGYFEHRDFDRLQDAFAAFFDGMADLMSDLIDEGTTQVALSMPFGFSPKVPEGQFATIRGLRPSAFFEPATRGSPDQFFSWWGKELNGPTALAMAEAHLWVLFPWRSPLSEGERNVGETSVDLLLCVMPLPESWKATASDLLDLLEAETDREPASDGIGYARGIVTRLLAGGWSIDIPGWFRDDVDEQGADFCSAHATVRVTTFLTELGPLESLQEFGQGQQGDIRFESERVSGAGVVSDRPEADWPEGRMLQGSVVGPDGTVVVNIVYRSAVLDDWAESVFRSVAPPLAEE